MEEQYSTTSGPYEEFRICFCGKIPSGSVEWYRLDVLVEEALLSKKAKRSTGELTPFSVAEHLPSYASLGGHIYSLGGQRRSYDGGETLLNDVWLLDFKSIEDLKPLTLWDPEPTKIVAHSQKSTTDTTDEETSLSDKPQPQPSQDMLQPSQDKISLIDKLEEPSLSDKPQPQPSQDMLQPSQDKPTNVSRSHDILETKLVPDDILKIKLVPVRKPGKYHNPDSDTASPTPLTAPTVEDWKPGSGKSHKGKYHKPDSDKLSPTPLTEVWKPDSDKLSPTPLTEDWKPGLPMNFARCNPHTMVVDHKLYVLGGFQPGQNQANGWIEVFDPEEKKWESLPSPPDQIHPSIMISGLCNSKKEIIIAKQRRDCHPWLFYSYNITTGCWKTVVHPESKFVHAESKASVHSSVERALILPPNIGRAVTVGNTLYWISTEEHNHKCTIRAYDLDRNMWFEDHLNTATIFGRHEYFSSIYSRGPGFLHLVDQKFCLLLQSTVPKKYSQSSIEYLYCVILDMSPIYEHEHEDWGKFELTTVSIQKYSMDHYIDFLDCMLLLRD